MLYVGQELRNNEGHVIAVVVENVEWGQPILATSLILTYGRKIKADKLLPADVQQALRALYGDSAAV